MKIPKLDVLIAILALSASLNSVQAAPKTNNQSNAESKISVSKLKILAKIIQHEDERLLDKELIALLALPDPDLRQRVALALGRIGDPSGVAPLMEILIKDGDAKLRAVVAFALGEIENQVAVPALLERLSAESNETLEVRGRAAEALGKITANKESASGLDKNRIKEISTAIVHLLPETTTAADHPLPQAKEASINSNQLSIEAKSAAFLALTALLRIKEPSSIEAITTQLRSPDPDLRWQAANVLARAKDGILPSVPALLPLLGDSDPLVKAQAARALGVAKAKQAAGRLIELLKDKDERPVISSISALGSIAAPEAVAPLLALGNRLLQRYNHANRKAEGVPSEQNMLLLIAVALAEIRDEQALPFLKALRSESARYGANPEVEIATAKFGEAAFFDLPEGDKFNSENWQSVAAHAQGLGELKGQHAKTTLLEMLAAKQDPRAVSDILNALAAVKAEKLGEILLDELKAGDVIVRSTAANLLAEAGESSSPVIDALAQALNVARQDKMNDARIAIIEAATKLKHPLNLQCLRGKTRDPDYIVRRRAIDLMKESGEQPSQTALQALPLKTGHNQKYWMRMAQLSMTPQNPSAVIHTRKGAISIELFSKDSPMMVDNFIQLAKSGFYNGLTFMRVVPNFVIQGGDPRNDMNGGPGYQIRDEINLHPYQAGTVGIALSGKDTGGSQFFITNLPQPHLDGGYTVIGQALRLSSDSSFWGLKQSAGEYTITGKNASEIPEIANRIARGDLIERIEIIEPK